MVLDGFGLIIGLKGCNLEIGNDGLTSSIQLELDV